MGGLDESDPTKLSFSPCCEMLSQVSFSIDENLYVPTTLQHMRKGRGCFATCFLDGVIYAVGGVTMNEGVLIECEKYDV